MGDGIRTQVIQQLIFWKIGGILEIRELSSNELKSIVHPSSNFGLLETPIPDLLLTLTASEVYTNYI